MYGLSATDQRNLLLSVGRRTGLRPLSPLEVAELLHRAIASGNSRKAVAEFLQLESSGMIGKFLRLLKLNTRLQYLVGWGNTSTDAVSFSAASELGRLQGEVVQSDLALSTLKYCLSGSEVRQIIDLMKRNQLSVEDAVERIVRTRPRNVIRQVIVGSISDVNLIPRLAALSQVHRDDLFARVIAKHFSDVGVEAWRLGSERFMLSGNETMDKKIDLHGDDPEAVISKAITEALAND